MLLLATFGVFPILVAAVVSLTNMNISAASPTGPTSSSSASRTTRSCSPTRTSGRRCGTPCSSSVIGVPCVVLLSLAVALLLNRSNGRFFRALRAFYFVPAITGIVAISLVWSYLYNTQFGLLQLAAVARRRGPGAVALRSDRWRNSRSASSRSGAAPGSTSSSCSQHCRACPVTISRPQRSMARARGRRRGRSRSRCSASRCSSSPSRR